MSGEGNPCWKGIIPFFLAAAAPPSPPGLAGQAPLPEPFLTEGSLAVLQTDPEWCGGVTELVRICGLAETFGVPVIPHGRGLHSALHVIASQSPGVCPMAEYLLRSMPDRHHFEVSPPAQVGGSFDLPRKPGFGIELDAAKIDTRRIWRPLQDCRGG